MRGDLGSNWGILGGEGLMHFLLLVTSFIISYAIGYLMGCKFRLRVSQEKGFEVGSASSIGIMVVGFTITFIFHSIGELIYAVSFGLASGFGNSIRLVKMKR